MLYSLAQVLCCEVEGLLTKLLGDESTMDLLFSLLQQVGIVHHSTSSIQVDDTIIVLQRHLDRSTLKMAQCTNCNACAERVAGLRHCGLLCPRRRHAAVQAHLRGHGLPAGERLHMAVALQETPLTTLLV